MRISLNWLKDYLDIKSDVDICQISDSLTLAGLEVESVERIHEKTKDILLGVVVAIRELSDGKMAYELDVQGDVVNVIGPKSDCSEKFIVAFKPKADMKNGFSGVTASFLDLGFPTGAGEIIAFEPDSFCDGVPHKLSDVKEFDDVIFTLGITPNRADALSHLGISRELSALLDLSFRSPMLTPKEMAGLTHEKVAIEIDNAEDCPRYACRVIENIVIKPSPMWMRLRLNAAGIRPINNVVDVTNYVMLSRGQPMHAFDYDKLHKENGRAKIIVRRAKPDEKLTALDGTKLTLTSDDVVISDREQAIALAGVIGGSESAIDSNSTTVLLEAAYFEPKNVRMSARRHNITTDSSYRFERGCDPSGVVDALNYAARLLTEITEGKVCREPIDAYRKRIDPQEIKMRPERAQAILGMDRDSFDQDLLRKRFLRLGIETIAKRGDAIYFRVPTHRFDLTREIDLIEEAARMLGYDKVKESHVSLGFESDQFSNKKSEMVIDHVRGSLTTCGFFEAVNYAFLNKEFQNHFLSPSDREKLIEIKNPLSDRYGVMRLSLIPGLIKNLLHNQRNQEKSILLFEVGTIFLGLRESGKNPNPSLLFGSLDQDSYSLEKTVIAGVMAGKDTFQAFDISEKTLDFYHIKGVLSETLQGLGLKYQFPGANTSFQHGADVPYLHPGESSTIIFRDNDQSIVLGYFGKLHPNIALALEVVGDAYVFELDLKEIADATLSLPKFKPFSRYPTIERDVALLVDEAVQVKDILQLAERVDEKEDSLVSLRVFDIYRGKNIESGKKSIAIALALQKNDRTLTDDEAEAFIGEFIKLAESETGAKVR